jgi:hypothetical protein
VSNFFGGSGGGGGGGSGTVTSINLSASGGLTATGGPITIAGSIAIGTTGRLSELSALGVTADTFVGGTGVALALRTASDVKTSLSLNNVENTALSTWAGSTNITTLGTITSGTWAGTAIDHGGLAGLADDDHTQYHNDTRGDARYYTQSQITTLLSGKSNTGHTHASTDITDFTEATQDVVGSTISANSTKISVVYSDVANTLKIDAVENQINHDALLNYSANKHIDHTSVSISAGTG